MYWIDNNVKKKTLKQDQETAQKSQCQTERRWYTGCQVGGCIARFEFKSISSLKVWNRPWQRGKKKLSLILTSAVRAGCYFCTSTSRGTCRPEKQVLIINWLTPVTVPLIPWGVYCGSISSVKQSESCCHHAQQQQTAGLWWLSHMKAHAFCVCTYLFYIRRRSSILFYKASSVQWQRTASLLFVDSKWLK